MVPSSAIRRSNRSRNLAEFPSVSHLKVLSIHPNTTVRILRTQVGHRRSTPASFPFPFIPNWIEKRRRKRKPSGDKIQQRKHPCPVAPASFKAVPSRAATEAQSDGEVNEAKPVRRVADLEAGLALL